MFDVGIRVTVVNQRGVLAKVATAIAEGGSNIDNVSMDEERSLYTTMHFTLQVANRMHLAKVLRSLRRVREVVRIARPRGIDVVEAEHHRRVERVALGVADFIGRTGPGREIAVAGTIDEDPGAHRRGLPGLMHRGNPVTFQDAGFPLARE